MLTLWALVHHGNCRPIRTSDAETQLLSYSVALGQIPRSTDHISSLCIFLVRSKTIVFGRTSVLLWFLFFPSRNLRAPWADRREILHDAPKYVRFYNPGPKFRVSLTKKILRAENMQNLARFRTTSKFGGQFLRNG